MMDGNGLSWFSAIKMLEVEGLVQNVCGGVGALALFLNILKVRWRQIHSKFELFQNKLI